MITCCAPNGREIGVHPSLQGASIPLLAAAALKKGTEGFLFSFFLNFFYFPLQPDTTNLIDPCAIVAECRQWGSGILQLARDANHVPFFLPSPLQSENAPF